LNVDGHWIEFIAEIICAQMTWQMALPPAKQEMTKSMPMHVDAAVHV
jgi:hypothetical protein